MPKLRATISEMSRIFGPPESAIEEYCKPLTKEKLITTGGRGKGAPDITIDDCAKILTVMMAGSPKHALQKFEEYGSIRTDLSNPYMCNKTSEFVANELALSKEHNFIEMLSALIKLSSDIENYYDIVDNVRKASGVDPIFSQKPEVKQKDSMPLTLTIHVSHQRPKAHVYFGSVVGFGGPRPGFFYFTEDFISNPSMRSADMDQIVEITGFGLLRLAYFMRGMDFEKIRYGTSE
ncbi:hypothetical protein FZ983_30365 [Azospirillum sp. B21]|uniref:hypothetical protein n=1 Tax=Azospirillum sp. B21 TaxID=2607496 RepID=UPI0011EC8DB5|nr:hypothetical protein [Azospirillum sp. B21]KAA0573322.1 hypothetical protein FZ983_30365 [Azospirillum sp. B21]